MTYTISKDFSLSYSHALIDLPSTHKCSRVHGHNAVVRVVMAIIEDNQLTAEGFVLDYGDLAPLDIWLTSAFDHRHLNDVVAFPPTAENMARRVFVWCEDRGWPVVEVGWSETPRTWATYRRTTAADWM